MAQKIQLNKKTLRVLSVDEMEAVAGGTLDSGSATDLRTVWGPQTTFNSTADSLTAPPPPETDTTL